jgi:Tol biopolymer transport system component
MTKTNNLPVRLLLLTFGCVVMLAAAAGVIVRRANSDVYGCVLFSDGTIMDVSSGRRMTDPRFEPLELPIIFEFASPKQNRTAFVTQGYPRVLRVRDESGEAQLLDNFSDISDLNWSPDANYVAYIWDSYERQIRVFSISAADGSQIYEHYITGSGQLWGWSPDGTRVAYSVNDMQNYRLVIADRETGQEDVIVANAPQNSSISPIRWSPVDRRYAYLLDSGSGYQLAIRNEDRTLTTDVPDLFVGQILWSPDGSHIAVNYTTPQGEPRLAVYRLEAYRIVPIEGIIQGSRLLFPTDAAWTTDSSAVLFWNERRDGRDLAAYRIAQDQTVIVLPAVEILDRNNPLRTIINDTYVITWRDNGRLAVDLFSTNATNRVRLIEGALRVYNVLTWEQTVVVLWERVENMMRETLITWTNLENGTQHTMMVGNVTQIENFLFTRNGLFGYATRSGTASVHMINLNTNEYHLLADNLTDYNFILPPDEQLRIRWQRSESSGIAAYNADGERVQHFVVPISAFAMDPQPIPNDTLFTIKTSRGEPAIYDMWLVSPNGDYAERFLSNYAALGFTWSPDGERISVLSSDGSSEKYEFLTRMGQMLRSIDHPTTLFTEWSRCD